MKKLFLIVCVLCLGLSACSTRGTIALADKEKPLAKEATFRNVDVTDSTGYVWGDDEQKVDLTASMKSALDTQLAKAGIAGSDYDIRTTLLSYAPGNAFHRWLMPGFGATTLSIKSEIYDRSGKLVATVPVDRYIGFGGAWTIGAWKTVFDDVAAEVVKVLQKATGRIGEKTRQEN